MLHKIIFLIFILISCLFLVTGCWDAYDVNQKTLVVTVVADKIGNDFAFYIETPNIGIGQNAQNGISSPNEKYSFLFAKGSSYGDARSHLNAEADNPLFLGTVKALILTDELAKYDIEEYMLRMQSDAQYRKALNVVTSASDPNDIFAIMPPNNVSIGESISDTITSLKAQGKIVVYTVTDILEFIYSDTCFVIINMDLQNGYLAYNGYSVIHHNKLIGFIPLDESRGLVWLLGDNVKRVYSSTSVDGCRVTTDVSLLSRKITPNYNNGKLTFNLKFKMDSQVMYLSQSIKFDEELQRIVKEELTRQIAEEIADAIKRSKEYNCDYLQFKEIFRIKYPEEEENINWHDAYLNAEFKISVESNLKFGSLMDYEASGENLTK